MGALLWMEIRRRWRGAAAVGLVLGVGFAAVLTAAAGARRTETAFPRMLAATDGAHLLVSGPHDLFPPAQRRFYERVAGLDGVAGTGLAVGLDLSPMRVPRGSGTAIGACANAALDRAYGYDVARPNVLEGRLPHRDRSDEILVSQSYADTFGVGVGDELDLVLSTDDEAPAAGEATAADGPVVHAAIVGIGVPATQVVPVSDLDAEPNVFASPAFVERHASDPATWCYDAAATVLEPGADVERIVAEIDRIGEPDGGAFIQDLDSSFTDVRRAIQPQVTALWLFAAAAAAVTLLVVVQVLGRQLQQSATVSKSVWRAVGVTRLQVGALVAAPSLVTAVVGGSVALAGAVVLSSRFPIGPARLAETDRGTEVHAGIHFGGALGVVLAAVVVGFLTGLLAVHVRPPSTRLGWLGRISGSASRPAVVVGVHLAAGSGRGEAAVPVRSAAVGAALAVAAVVATVTFARGLDDLVSVPERYGQDWDVMLDGEFGPTPVGRVLDELGEDPAVAGIAGGRYGEVVIDGARVSTVGLTDLVGTTFPATIDGRAPARSDEIVLGTRSLRDLGRSIGDRVDVDAGMGPREMTIVGTAAFPRLNHGSFSLLGLGTGAMALAEVFPPFDLQALGDPPPGIEPGDFIGPDGENFGFVTIRVSPDATPRDRREIVTTASDIGDANMQIVRLEQRPTAIDSYADVRSTPFVLGVLLGAMATATLTHLVANVVRRRRRDLALCAALGMRGAQLLSAVVIQAVIVAGASLVIGLPLGVAAGRVAWSGFASDLGVVDTLRLPIVALLLAVPVVLIVAVAVATVPAVVAARTRPALVLRSE